MPSWFSKVFKQEPPRPPAPVEVDVYDEDEEELEPPRRVVHAPVLSEVSEAQPAGEGIRIKACVDERHRTCVFMVDRPVLEGLSFWCPDPDTAYAYAPLAGAIFDLTGIANVLIHGPNVTVQREGWGQAAGWEDWARQVGAQIRAHLDSGMPVVLPEVLESMPPAGEIKARLQAIIDEQINPGIAGHGGFINITRVVGNTAYITMGGGCQGCAASSLTLRMGVERAFRDAVPELGAILDETDHSAGTNPFFTELPAGMGM